MEKIKGNVFIIAIIFACILMVAIGYWWGNGNTDGIVKDATKHLQSKLDDAIKRESQINQQYDDIRKILSAATKQSEDISTDVAGLAKQNNSNLARARAIQNRFDKYKNGF